MLAYDSVAAWASTNDRKIGEVCRFNRAMRLPPVFCRYVFVSSFYDVCVNVPLAVYFVYLCFAYLFIYFPSER